MVFLISSCGPALSDAARIWCLEHDTTSPNPALVGAGDDAVLQAADALGIEVPPEVEAANRAFLLYQMGNDDLSGVPEGWTDVRDQWRTTADYARACSAAFEAR
jgi:hypothetical protein